MNRRVHDRQRLVAVASRERAYERTTVHTFRTACMTNGWKKLAWKPSDRMQSYGYRHPPNSEESVLFCSPFLSLSLSL